jgi:hypothetical protein
MRLTLFGLLESKETRTQRARKELEIAEMLSIRSSSIGELMNYIRRLHWFKQRAEQRLAVPEATGEHDCK